jgi:hypothetical protein
MVPTSVEQQLERYRSLLTAIRPTFSEEKAALLCDLFNGTLFEPWRWSVQLLPQEVEKAPLRYFEKWEVDKRAFVRVLEDLSLPEKAAVADAIERFWKNEQRTLSGVGLTDPAPEHPTD